MTRSRRLSRLKWTKRIVFGVVAVVATFGAGYLAAGAKEDPTTPYGRLLIPEGYKVASVADVNGLLWVRAEDAAGVTHVLTYERGKGDRRIVTHFVFAAVPADQAFKD